MSETLKNTDQIELSDDTKAVLERAGDRYHDHKIYIGRIATASAALEKIDINDPKISLGRVYGLEREVKMATERGGWSDSKAEAEFGPGGHFTDILQEHALKENDERDSNSVADRAEAGKYISPYEDDDREYPEASEEQ